MNEREMQKRIETLEMQLALQHLAMQALTEVLKAVTEKIGGVDLRQSPLMQRIAATVRQQAPKHLPPVKDMQEFIGLMHPQIPDGLNEDGTPWTK